MPSKPNIPVKVPGDKVTSTEINEIVDKFAIKIENADELDSGTLPPARIGNDSIVEGKLDSAVVTKLNERTTDASDLTSGTLPPARIGDGSLEEVKLSTAVANKLNTSYIKPDGTVPLTSDWDAGSFQITAGSFVGDGSGLTGTIPITRIADGTITEPKLDASVQTKLNTYTTDASDLTSGILPPARIGDDSIVEGKLDSAVVTKLDERTTNAGDLTSGFLPIARIQDGTVTEAKLSTSVQTKLNDYNEATTRESNTVLFDKDYVIGEAAARTGDVLIDVTGSKKMAVTTMLHNDSSPFQFFQSDGVTPFVFAQEVGFYLDGEDNYLDFQFLWSGAVRLTISN